LVLTTELAGFGGPSIYNRTLLALQSTVPEEVQYALHHLVKISHERGDKYRFDQFVGLADALLEKVLDVSLLFYGFRWHISYDTMDSPELDVLNGLRGTRNLLHKIKTHRPLDIRDDLQTDEFAKLLGNINEAGLVLRNMAMLDENAHYLVRTPLIRDIIAIVLHLPRRACVVELQHYVLEIAEQLTKFFSLPAEDPLYLSLIAQLDSNDRGVIVITLRAISRISMHLEERNRLPGLPIHSLKRICDWLLVEDEELRNACLDFLYQYTGDVDNVKALLRNTNVESLVQQLSRNLMHGATINESRERSRSTITRSKGAEAPPKLSKSIVDQLCASGDARELSSQWQVDVI
jgi:chromatin structure-remodeling complex subunit RSC9